MELAPPLFDIGQRGSGENLETSFGIVEGNDNAAADVLLNLLRQGNEVSLANDLDEGGEGRTHFRKSAQGYAVAYGGHGWQGGWVKVDEATVRTMIVALAPLNRGDHWTREGSYCRPKKL